MPGQFALFFTGPEEIQVPFGDGFRCVGAGSVGLFRLGPPQLPGERRSFQLWYRDPAAGGSGFNLSNGVTVTFCP